MGTGSAGAVPPSDVTATQDHGRVTLHWADPPDTVAVDIIFSTKPGRSAAIGRVFLDGSPTTWTGTTPLRPGTYYIFVGTASCDGCAFEYAPAVKIKVPEWTIQPGKGIANVTVGMSKKNVELYIGDRHDARWSSDTNYTQYTYGGKGLYFSFLGDLSKHRVVHHMSAGRPRYYVEGTKIHIGSTEKALRAAFPKIKCRNFLYINLVERDCTIGRRAKGAVVTVFYVWKGRISSIAVGKLRYLKGDSFYPS
jgi:hypothetical protein